MRNVKWKVQDCLIMSRGVIAGHSGGNLASMDNGGSGGDLIGADKLRN